tara:strand:- start:566 stop:757 length:192 start_codon:yes stop_codon:yes gene_type:complete
MNNDMNDNIAISDSLKVNQNEDGTFTLEWDKEDPTWKFLNGLTSKEITAMIEQAIKMEENGPL